jgi:hypothetical protein
LKSIDHTLDEVSDGRFIVVNDVARSEAISGNNHLRMKARTEKIYGHYWSAREFFIRINGLAQHHFVSLERGMGMTADRMADDLSEKHGS